MDDGSILAIETCLERAIHAVKEVAAMLPRLEAEMLLPGARRGSASLYGQMAKRRRAAREFPR